MPTHVKMSYEYILHSDIHKYYYVRVRISNVKQLFFLAMTTYATAYFNKIESIYANEFTLKWDNSLLTTQRPAKKYSIPVNVVLFEGRV